MNQVVDRVRGLDRRLLLVRKFWQVNKIYEMLILCYVAKNYLGDLVDRQAGRHILVDTINE